MNRIIPLVLVAVLSSIITPEASSTPMEGGTVLTNATPLEGKILKSTVFLKLEGFDGGGSSNCTGVMLNQNTVATAAHCFDDPGAITAINFLSRSNRSATGYGTHLGFTYGSTRDDIAKVTLGSERNARTLAPTSGPVQPQMKLVPGSAIKKGMKLIIVGAGLEIPHTKTGPCRLKYNELTVTSVGPGSFKGVISNGRICPGDSGGPAYLVGQDGNLALAGIVSSYMTAGRDAGCGGDRRLHHHRWLKL